MAGEIGNAASGAVTSQNFAKTTDYAVRRPWLNLSMKYLVAMRAVRKRPPSWGNVESDWGSESAALAAPWHQAP